MENLSREELLEKLKEVCEYNERQMKLADYDQNHAKDLIEVEFEGFASWTMLYDETLRFEVDPFDYYGEEKVIELIKKYEEFKKQSI